MYFLGFFSAPSTMLARLCVLVLAAAAATPSATEQGSAPRPESSSTPTPSPSTPAATPAATAAATSAATSAATPRARLASLSYVPFSPTGAATIGSRRVLLAPSILFDREATALVAALESLVSCYPFFCHLSQSLLSRVPFFMCVSHLPRVLCDA